MNNINDSIQLKENAKIGEKYYYFKHKSGLDIYVVPKNHTTSYALFATKYGSVNRVFKTDKDDDFITVPDGIAHFLEHKLFEEENGEDAFLRFAKTGASANAYTSFDRTAYLFSATSNFLESLEILLDFVTHPYFSEQTVQKEQGIIGQEIRMYDDNPGWQVFFNMLVALYKENTVKIDIAGTVESIAKINAEVLYRCYNTFYNLNNMALCVAGNISPEDVMKVADKTLKASEPITITRGEYTEPDGVNMPIVEKKLMVSEPQFSIGIKINDIKKDGRSNAKMSFAADIINEIMFGRASEFYSKYYNEGLITKFGAGADVTPGFAFISISGESKDPMRVLQCVKDTINEYKIKGFDKEEFEIYKRVQYAHSVTMFEKTDNIANAFISALFAGYDLFDTPEIIASVTFEDVQECFGKIFKEENMAISIVNPLE